MSDHGEMASLIRGKCFESRSIRSCFKGMITPVPGWAEKCPGLVSFPGQGVRTQRQVTCLGTQTRTIGKPAFTADLEKT
jgi:hypothetical protein